MSAEYIDMYRQRRRELESKIEEGRKSISKSSSGDRLSFDPDWAEETSHILDRGLCYLFAQALIDAGRKPAAYISDAERDDWMGAMGRLRLEQTPSGQVFDFDELEAIILYVAGSPDWPYVLEPAALNSAYQELRHELRREKTKAATTSDRSSERPSQQTGGPPSMGKLQERAARRRALEAANVAGRGA